MKPDRFPFPQQIRRLRIGTDRALHDLRKESEEKRRFPRMPAHFCSFPIYIRHISDRLERIERDPDRDHRFCLLQKRQAACLFRQPVPVEHKETTVFQIPQDTEQHQDAKCKDFLFSSYSLCPDAFLCAFFRGFRHSLFPQPCHPCAYIMRKQRCTYKKQHEHFTDRPVKEISGKQKYEPPYATRHQLIDACRKRKKHDQISCCMICHIILLSFFTQYVPSRTGGPAAAQAQMFLILIRMP